MPEATLHVGSGKVRELYALDDERLLLVASDRISTFDVVLPTEIPDKGRVLTGLSGFWFARTAGICEVSIEADAGQPLECFHVACPSACDDIVRKLGARRRLVPPERLAVITDELLVERRLRASCGVVVGGPEAR